MISPATFFFGIRHVRIDKNDGELDRRQGAAELNTVQVLDKERDCYISGISGHQTETCHCQFGCEKMRLCSYTRHDQGNR